VGCGYRVESSKRQAEQPRDPDEARLKQLNTIIEMLSGWGKVMASSDKMNALYDRPPASIADRLTAATDVQALIKSAAGAGWSSVLFAAATLFAARVGGTEKEKTLLGAKALAYAQGLGSNAQKLLKAEREVLAKKIATANPRLNKVGVGGQREWQAEAQSLQRRLDKAVEANGTKSVVGKMRVSGLLLIADALGTLVGTGKAGIKMDFRTAFETSGQYLTLMGSFRGLRTALCEDMVFKTVVTEVTEKAITVAPFAQGTQLDQVAIDKLLKLRQAAGRYTIGGGLVMAGLDVFDGWRAMRDENYALAWAYWIRAGGGGAMLAGVRISMLTVRMATLVARLNLVGIIITVAATIAIEMLKPKLWEDWFRAQPFRSDKGNTDSSWSQQLAKPSPHKNEAQMLSKLDEAVGDAKTGG
jgi:hypothetical protein